MTALARLLDTSDPVATRDKVNFIQAQMLQHKDHILALPLKHYFAPGVYAREIFIPKDTLVVGKIHKYPQINIMSKGDLSVLTEYGVVRVQPPFTIVSPPNTKRIVYAHEDTVWTTIIGTDETDIDKLDGLLTAQTDDEYADFVTHTKMKEIA